MCCNKIQLLCKVKLYIPITLSYKIALSWTLEKIVIHEKATYTTRKNSWQIKIHKICTWNPRRNTRFCAPLSKCVNSQHQNYECKIFMKTQVNSSHPSTKLLNSTSRRNVPYRASKQTPLQRGLLWRPILPSMSHVLSSDCGQPVFVTSL